MKKLNGIIFCVSCLASGLALCENSNFVFVSQLNLATTVVPLPEADQQYSAKTPINAITVDKNGQMAQTQYTYDPSQGGIVINNYEELDGPDSSIFFPAFGIGLLWANGYWVDQNGYYWDGNRYVLIDDDHWHEHWHHYWHRGWNNKWNHYRGQNQGARNIHGQRNGNFQHRQGMNRPSYHSSRGHGGQSHGHGGGKGR